MPIANLDLNLLTALDALLESLVVNRSGSGFLARVGADNPWNFPVVDTSGWRPVDETFGVRASNGIWSSTGTVTITNDEPTVTVSSPCPALTTNRCTVELLTAVIRAADRVAEMKRLFCPMTMLSANPVPLTWI